MFHFHISLIVLCNSLCSQESFAWVWRRAYNDKLSINLAKVFIVKIRIYILLILNVVRLCARNCVALTTLIYQILLTPLYFLFQPRALDLCSPLNRVLWTPRNNLTHLHVAKLTQSNNYENIVCWRYVNCRLISKQLSGLVTRWSSIILL